MTRGVSSPLKIFYDGECPFCARYVVMLRLKKTGSVQLVDLRSALPIRLELEAAGFDLDQGMVVEDGGHRYSGADAVAYLAALSTNSDLLNRINRMLLSRAGVARLVYPLMRSGRWFALFLLNRRMIEDTEDSNQARREIFSIFFGLFSIFHFFNYSFEYNRFPPSWDLVLVLLAAIVAVLRPASTRALFVLMLASTISTVVQAPIGSNHTIVRAAALAGYWLSFGYTMARNQHISLIFERFAPAGCGALLVMYFFGVFHKINADFLDPATSCAMALWHQMPRPLAALNGPVIEYGAIYGTFVVEGMIAAALLTRRFRHVGIAAGIAFHLLLSLSAYAMYLSFTTLALALHVLFLNESAARSIIGSPIFVMVRTKMRQPIYKLLVVTLIISLAVFSFTGEYTAVSIAALPLILPFCWAVLRYGSQPGPYVTSRSTLGVGALVTALFFVNCSLPYLGLKTAQTVNMFSNLRLEAGISNHLVFSSPPTAFHYLERVAIVEKMGDNRHLAWVKNPGMGIVFYDLLSELQKDPGLKVTFTLDGRRYADVSAEDFPEEIKMLHPQWFRKFFHFQPVSLQQPEPCNV